MANKVWYLKILPGITHTFPLRYIEWILGFGIAFWGLHLLDGPDSFKTLDGTWKGLAYWGPDYAWGLAMTIVGILRLAALTINGTFHDTVYARYSPIVRGATAFLCSLMWVAVALSAAAASAQDSVIYQILFILDALTAYYVSGESGDTLRAHRHGRKGI